MKHWDDKGARERMKKACAAGIGEPQSRVYAGICRALNYGMKHSDAPVMADEIAAAIYEAFEHGRRYEQERRTGRPVETSGPPLH